MFNCVGDNLVIRYLIMSCINFLKFFFCLWRGDLIDEDIFFNWCLIVLDVILLGMGFMLGFGLYVVIG